jgi:hypothetical protein
MISNDHAFTATNKIKRPSYSTVVTWVKDSWEEVSVNLIKNSFKCCGISTELDGSEDDLLFDYENLLGPVNDDEEIEDPNDQSSDEEYSEEDNYKNNWDIGKDANEIDNEIDNEDNESCSEVEGEGADAK